MSDFNNNIVNEQPDLAHEILERLERIEQKIEGKQIQTWLAYPAELADELKISDRKARSLRSAGLLPSLRNEGGGKYYFHRDDLAACKEFLGL